MSSSEPHASRPAARRRRHRRLRLLRTIAVLAVIGVGSALAVILTQSSPNLRGSSPPGPPHRPTTVVDGAPACSVVVALEAMVSGYQTAGAVTPSSSLQATLAGAPVSLPAINRVGQFLEVRIFGRPNGQTTWVKISPSLRLLRDPYRIIVDLGHRRLLLYRSGRIVLQAAAAVGSTATPTPLGHYFVVLLAQAPSADYGPFVLVTSAVADGVTDWEQQNQPVIAITGPLQWGQAIAGGGGAVTAGGIAVQSSDLSKLRPVPLGTPVDVVSSWNPPVLPPRHRRPPVVPRTVVPLAENVPKSLAC